MTLNEIRERKARAVKEMRALLDKSETEKRSLTTEENSRFDALKAEITDLEGQEARALDGAEAEFNAEVERRTGRKAI